MRPRALVLVGGPYHDAPENRAAFVEALDSAGAVDLTVTTDHDALLGLGDGGYRLVVVYTTRGVVTPEQGGALLDFVAGGHGLVGIHGAATSYHDCPGYDAMLGCGFLRHPPLQPIAVRATRPDDPLLAGVGDFTVEDEHYQLWLTADDLDVLTVSRLADLEQPSTYTRRQGAGRVWYTALGHDRRTLGSSAFRTLLRHGLRWAAGGAP